MDWRRHSRGTEAVCLVVGRADPSCVELTEMAGMELGVGYVRPLERVAVIVKVPPMVHGVGIREIDGVQWAALVADEGDPDSGRPGFYYRFLDGNEVSGIISTGASDTGYVEFSVSVDGRNVSTGLGVAGTDVPELRSLPGTKRVIASGDEGGGYTVILRATEDELCFHLGSVERCRPASADEAPIRLTLAVARPCRPADECGPPGGTDRYRELTIVAGEVAPGVERVGLRDPGGTSFVQTSAVFESPEGESRGDRPNTFATVLYYRFDGEVVAFDGDRELGAVPVVIEDQEDPRLEAVLRRKGFLERHLANLRARLENESTPDPNVRRAERRVRRLLEQLRRDERRLRQRLGRDRS